MTAKTKPRLSWRRRFRYIYMRFIRLRAHPKEIARGLAAGVFAGSYPFLGLQTILGVAIATAIRGNKLIAAAGTWVSNPITDVPIYLFNYQLGRRILRQPPQEIFAAEQSLQDLMNTGLDITAALLTGSTVVGVIFAGLSYYLGLAVATQVHRRRRRRR